MKAVRNASRGFTLMEVLVTVVLVSLALVGALSGIRAIKNADAKAQTADLLQRLAAEKINDLRLLQDPSANGSDGDFADRGYPDITWNLQETAASVTNMVQITLTVTRSKDTQALTTLLYIVPQTGTTTSTTTAATGTGT
jgi:prepilin-type N-terminal cleavage/methylation domain-containing protein